MRAVSAIESVAVWRYVYPMQIEFNSVNKPLVYRSAIVAGATLVILGGCLLIIAPFIPALLLAAIFVLATWPAFDWLQKRLNGRTTLAALLMTILLALCFLVPLVFFGSSLADDFTQIVRQAIDAFQRSEGAPPLWLGDIPLIGPYATSLWLEYLSDSEQLIETLQGYIGPVSQQLIAIGAVVGQGMLDIAIGVFIAFFFFRNGLQVAGHIRVLTDKFFGPRGQHLLLVSKKTVIGIVYGMLGTALAQGALAALGFWIAGVPGAPFLGLLTFMLSFFPVGAPLIWVPATIWLFSEGQTAMAVFMGIWGLLVVSSIDNVIRPYFISLGSSLPLLIVLLGVFGGIFAFGFIGLFIGPTLLAVAYAIVTEWGRSDREPGLMERAPAA